jgi:hypothetical protein
MTWAHPATPTGLCGGSVTPSIKNHATWFFMLGATAPQPPLNWYFVKPGHAVLLGKQTTRSACRFGRLQSLAHEPGAPPARVSPWLRAPLARNLVVPSSGARRATWTQQHASRAALDAPVELVLCKTGAHRATWVTNNTLRIGRRSFVDTLRKASELPHQSRCVTRSMGESFRVNLRNQGQTLHDFFFRFPLSCTQLR